MKLDLFFFFFFCISFNLNLITAYLSTSACFNLAVNYLELSKRVENIKCIQYSIIHFMQELHNRKFAFCSLPGDTPIVNNNTGGSFGTEENEWSISYFMDFFLFQKILNDSKSSKEIIHVSWMKITTEFVKYFFRNLWMNYLKQQKLCKKLSF
jgi:hypothetical protein